MFIFKLKKNELNVFSKSIHALEKFNKCTNLVFQSKCLRFVAVDESGSSFVEITIKGTLHHAIGIKNSNRELPVLEHRIDVTAVKSVARFCNKMAECIDITIDPLYEYMIFAVCGTEITETVPFTIAKNIVSPPVPTVNRITTKQEVLRNVLRCLKLQDSLSMCLTPTYATFLPFTAPTKRADSSVIPSQVLLMHSQFTDYMVQEYTRLSFRVSHLKAVLAFARAMQAPLYLRFDTSGSPVTFTAVTFSYTANFSLATLGKCRPTTIGLGNGFDNVMMYSPQDDLRRTAGTRRSKRITQMATPALERYRNLTQNRQRRLSDESSF